jgi:hypothetical protein
VAELSLQAQESERRKKSHLSPVSLCEGCQFWIWADQGMIYTAAPSRFYHNYHDDGCAPAGAVIKYRREAVGVSES